jgi:cytochrome c biogenesis protein CcmG/thiol:disulfide interchange protein DsbE
MANSKRDADESGSSALYGLAGALLVFGFLGAFAFLPRVFAGVGSGAAQGKPAPDIDMPVIANGADLEAAVDSSRDAAPVAPGAPASMKLSDLRGKAVLLDFWATWCGPCRAEMPIVDKIAQRYKDQGLVTIGVNAGEDADDVAPWIKANGVHYPIVGDNGSSQRSFGVDSLPTLVVISRDGKITAIRIGMTEAAELERLVKAVL